MCDEDGVRLMVYGYRCIDVNIPSQPRHMQSCKTPWLFATSCHYAPHILRGSGVCVYVHIPAPHNENNNNLLNLFKTIQQTARAPAGKIPGAYSTFSDKYRVPIGLSSSLLILKLPSERDPYGPFLSLSVVAAQLVTPRTAH